MMQHALMQVIDHWLNFMVVSERKLSPRRFLRVSVATLLLLTAVFCVWLARIAHRATTQQAAIALIEEAKGAVHFSHEARAWPLPYQEFSSSLTFDSTQTVSGPVWLRNSIGSDYFRELVAVELADRKAGSDELMTALRQLPGLLWLDLARNDITNDMLTMVAAMGQLRVLVLDRNPKLSDAGLASLSSLSDLEVLGVNLISSISGEFLKDFNRLTSLRELDVQYTSFEGENLRFLAGHPKIRRLTLRKTNVGNEHIAYLSTMPELRLLDIGETPVTEAGIAELVSVPLIHLYIEGPLVTDDWVTHLSEMKTLEHVAIWNTRIGDGAIQELREALPGCNIDYRNDASQ